MQAQANEERYKALMEKNERTRALIKQRDQVKKEQIEASLYESHAVAMKLIEERKNKMKYC